jgi:hypothetical protein
MARRVKRGGAIMVWRAFAKIKMGVAVSARIDIDRGTG